MSSIALTKPQLIAVRRSELRQKQRQMLRKARGRRVLVIPPTGSRGAEKYILDKEYFEELRGKCASLIETLEILADRKLFDQILAADPTLERDLRSGRLHSLEEAFAEG